MQGFRLRKKRKDYAFRRQIDEKPSIAQAFTLSFTIQGATASASMKTASADVNQVTTT